MQPTNSPIRSTPDGVLIDVWVVPGASRTELKGVHDGAVRLRVASPPTGGEANRAVERFLASRLRCQAVIVKGTASRRKQVRIDCADLAAVAQSLGIGLH